MIYMGTIIFGTLILLGVEWIFRLDKRGRNVLTVIYLAWTVVDAALSAKDNPGFMVGAFFFSFCDSLVPLVLWQWISSAIRSSRERRNVGKGKTPMIAQDTRKNPALDYIKSMQQNHTTEALIAALPGISDALYSEAKESAKSLKLNDHRFVECVLDLELLAGFNKALEFTKDKELASLFVDAIVFNLTDGNPGAVPSEMEFRIGGTENYRGIAKYGLAKDHFNMPFPEAWLFGKEFSKLKIGNAMDFAYVASVAPMVAIIMKKGAFIFEHFLKPA